MADKRFVTVLCHSIWCRAPPSVDQLHPARRSPTTVPGGLPALPSTGYVFGLPHQQQMVSMPHLGMQFGSPAGIPLMSFSTMTWAPVADQQTLVAHGSNCPLCAEFLRHYTAGASEQSFRDAQTHVQTELQGRFWAHFERHTRSEGGRDRKHITELETRLQTLQAEHDSEQERLEQERNKARRQLKEEQRRRQAMSTTATSSTRISMPSNQSASHRRRDLRGESPRRRIMDPLPVAGSSSVGTMSSASFSMPYSAQPSMAGPSTLFAVPYLAQPSMAGPSTLFVTPYPTQPNMAGPSVSYQSMASRSPVEHPMVDFE
ncbi:hypothetical protein TRAPUB_4256 [Trametes pubescens]|uniref:Uncharacterized protein n=1 Tax=Trametes pubescens TaxID=154538 RepID=A0A1M2VBP2_TRAPU|nr:hypothetical protein TRAPUB_4256 [Trametes pubescens]